MLCELHDEEPDYYGRAAKQIHYDLRTVNSLRVSNETRSWWLVKLEFVSCCEQPRVEIGYRGCVKYRRVARERRAYRVWRGSQVHSEEVSLSQSLFGGRTAWFVRSVCVFAALYSLHKFCGDRDPILHRRRPFPARDWSRRFIESETVCLRRENR